MWLFLSKRAVNAGASIGYTQANWPSVLNALLGSLLRFYGLRSIAVKGVLRMRNARRVCVCA